MSSWLKNIFSFKNYNDKQTETTKILGIPVSQTYEHNGYVIKKLFGGLYKSKCNDLYKKYYLLGMQIANKNIVINDKRLYVDIYNFIHYDKLAKRLHSKIFPKYKDIYTDCDVVLYACGPSANYYSKLDNAKHVSVNRALLNKDIKFDILFMHDNEFVVENLELLKGYKAEKFCAFHTNLENAKKFNTPSDYVKDIDAKRFIISDPAFQGVDNSHIDVINPDITDGMFYDRGGGTVFSALQFILYTHPQKIYLVGCDCTNSGYFYSKQNKNILLENTIKLWKDAAAMIKMLYPDIEIISINPVNLAGVFNDVYTQSYVNAHPELSKDDIKIIDSLELVKQ